MDLSFDEAVALVILALSLVAAGMKIRTLLGTHRSSATWEAGGPNGSAGSHLRYRAFHQSMQIAPLDPVDRMTWAHSAKAKEEFKTQQAATAVASRAAADAADHADGREHALRREVAAERRASIVPDLVHLGIAIAVACLSAVVALT